MLVVGLALICLGLGLAIVKIAIQKQNFGCQQTGPDPQYWGRAPDGVYLVLFYEANSTPVFFPLCPSYGGQLHGEYEINPDLLPFHGWAYVTLKNNVIVEIEYEE